MGLIKINTAKGDRLIGPGQPVFIIAELSGNHNGSIDRAKALIDAAAEAKVDAVKLQTYTPDTLTIDCDNEYFQIKGDSPWANKTLYQLYGEAYTPWEWHAELKEYVESKGLIFFSTPFDETADDFLEELNVPLYKVASFESGDLELLKKIGQTKKPVIISRGLTPVEDIEIALKTLRDNGSDQIAVLHCVSSYPAIPEEMNLKTIPDISDKFKVASGLSDHTLGTTVPLTSVGLGASIIEKHFTLKRSDGGPDADFSLEPEEMKQLVDDVRTAEKALGQPTYDSGSKESANLIFKRSLFVVADMKAGEEFTKENVRCIRPGYGMPPKFLGKVIGKVATEDIKRGTPLKNGLVK